MKNASAKNTVAVLYVMVMALALSVGAFAGTAHAQIGTDNGGYGGFGGVDIYDEYFSPFGSDTYDEYFSPSSYDIYDEYFTPTAYDTYDEYFTPSYGGSSYGSSYGTSATYGTSYLPSYAAQYIPTYAMQYLPSYFQPQHPTPSPIYTMTSAPITNTNTNTSVNTNTNTPTAVATATNGPITNTNTFAPVINVGSTGAHRIAEAVLPAPYCTIYASNAYSTGYYSQPITLTWNSQNATRGYISPNVGNVQAQGSITVHPRGYTTYTLTVYGAGGSATCQTAANYASSYVPPAPVYTAAPATPYVSLSQIPYTGFDFGPVGNAMYWAVLLAIAAAAGYLLVYFMPGRRNFAFANFTGGRKNDPMRDASRSNVAGAFENEDLQTVFKSSIVPAASIPTVLDAEESYEPAASALPKIEASRLTADSMIIDHSSGSPRIVIARN